MAETTSEYSTFQSQRPFLTVDIVEWYYHLPVEPMEFCKTRESRPSHGTPEEVPRGRPKPLTGMVDDEDRAMSGVEERADERFLISASTSDGIDLSENSYENAIEK